MTVTRRVTLAAVCAVGVLALTGCREAPDTAPQAPQHAPVVLQVPATPTATPPVTR